MFQTLKNLSGKYDNAEVIRFALINYHALLFAASQGKKIWVGEDRDTAQEYEIQ